MIARDIWMTFTTWSRKTWAATKKFWGDQGDRVLMGLSFLVAVYTIYIALHGVAEGQDRFARMNALLLGLLVISWLMSLCQKINTRAWATGLAFASFLLWAMAVVYGAGGNTKALSDVLCILPKCT